MRAVPKMPKLETEYLIRELREVVRTATMENANFEGIGGNEHPVTEMIREKTRLWRQSYILGPLNNLIERYERALLEQDKSK